ncbi:hypothetical protein AF332_12040 [Sporosarcina globispora]|uniref:Uncharacterized protein n=1 Tax=Sporosarcina globispora TaxID=1459 RepID=A0A0M0GDI7_SPOGL|nr:hypothetical protein [Sporosarcina globispora]KON87486.1 hypothetical protein AF332_12040 [Sporosarcina globispora]
MEKPIGKITKDEFDYIELFVQHEQLYKEFQCANSVAVDLFDICIEMLNDPKISKETLDKIIPKLNTVNEILNRGYEWGVVKDTVN